MHSASIVDISDHMPLKIEFIETPEKVNEILGKLEELVGTGMIEVQETTVAKPAQVSKPKKATPPSHMKIEGKAKLMRIYIGESDRWRRQAASPGTRRGHESQRHRRCDGVSRHTRDTECIVECTRISRCISRTTPPSCSPSLTQR